MTELSEPSPQGSDHENEIASFEELGLRLPLLKAVFDQGFVQPSVIQKRGIKPLIDGRDVIALAQSGSGKTGTFTIAALQMIEFTVQQCQVIILAPTRELSQQISTTAMVLGQGLHVICHACVGGTDLRDDINRLREGVHMVVGTPGRVFDMLETRKALTTNYLKIFVLDGADEIMARGFKAQVDSILTMVPNFAQLALFSATLPVAVQELTTKFMKNPKTISMASTELSLERVHQFYVPVAEERFKFATLCDMYETFAIAESIVYVNSRRKADLLQESLIREEYTVSKMHGDMPQHEREMVMREFQSGSSRILVTTDRITKGLNFDKVALIINYDMPTPLDNYLIRIGRGTRSGNKGVAVSFVTDEEADLVDEITQLFDTELSEIPPHLNELLAV